MATFRFTAGPWNIHEGNETFGPGHRKSIPLEEKMKKYAEIGLAGMQFHDDDAVPDMNNMSSRSPMSPSTAPSAALPATHWLSALTLSIRTVSACASNPRTPSSPASIPPTTWASRWLSTSCGASI